MEILGEIILVVLLVECATFYVFGWFISKETEKKFLELDFNDFEFNSFSDSILSTNPYISTVPLPILTKYYINGEGTILKWSKLHKKIEKHYKNNK